MLKQLKLYYILVSLPFVLLLTGSVVFFEAIKSTISRNPHPQINYTIFVIILIGGVIVLLNSRRLMREAKALVAFSKAIHAKIDSASLKEMANRYDCDIACLLQMIAVSGDRSISHQEQAALEHELANVNSRLNRRNALPQYLTGLLVGMGLLGTFIGLLATLGDISALIGSFADLDMSNADPIKVFSNMIERMKAPMRSMAIAFSASMFGLLGSIILGLMMVGIRRLQGDIFSLLSSEIARHIEIALSFESLTFRGGDTSIGCYGESSDPTSPILLRIEERLAETARIRQRALSSEIDDFKKQRADMMQVLSEQAEASNNFCGELQQLGSQLSNIFNSMENSNSQVSSQISELTVQLSGDSKETHKLLATQVDEQKRLKDTLDNYNIKEWLAESAQMQQRALSAEIEDFKNQRSEILQALVAQTDSNKTSHNELQQLGGQLESIFNSTEKGNSELSSQLSELTIHTGADAKESHRLLHVMSNNMHSDLQQLGSQVGHHLDTVSSVAEKGNDELSSKISALTTQLDTGSKDALQQIENTSNNVRSDLQQLASQLGTIFNATEEGSNKVCTQLSELKSHLVADAKESHQQFDTASSDFREELQQLGSQLGTIFNVMDKGNGEICTQISGLMAHIAADTKESHHLFDGASSDFREELQQLGSQLGTICNVMEKSNEEICTQISALAVHETSDEPTEEDDTGSQE